MAKAIGRFIVADPRVCHGQPTFRGTRILVADVLDQVCAAGTRDPDEPQGRDRARQQMNVLDENIPEDQR